MNCIVAVVDILENINFYNWRLTQLRLLITIITLRGSYSRRDKDNLGRMLEGYTYYTYKTCTIALDDSRN